MSLSTLRAVGDEVFSIVPALSAAKLTVALAGTGDMNAVRKLREFTLELHTEVQRLQLSEVTVQVRELYFLNSSCIKQLALWIKSIRELPLSTRYRVRFDTNVNLGWQRRALGALQAMATELVSID